MPHNFNGALFIHKVTYFLHHLYCLSFGGLNTQHNFSHFSNDPSYNKSNEKNVKVISYVYRILIGRNRLSMIEYSLHMYCSPFLLIFPPNQSI